MRSTRSCSSGRLSAGDVAQSSSKDSHSDLTTRDGRVRDPARPCHTWLAARLKPPGAVVHSRDERPRRRIGRPRARARVEAGLGRGGRRGARGARESRHRRRSRPATRCAPKTTRGCSRLCREHGDRPRRHRARGAARRRTSRTRCGTAASPVFGPSAAAARIEGSKGFAKDVMRRPASPPPRGSTSRARRASSRPTASPPARASSSAGRRPRPTRRWAASAGSATPSSSRSSSRARRSPSSRSATARERARASRRARREAPARRRRRAEHGRDGRLLARAGGSIADAGDRARRARSTSRSSPSWTVAARPSSACSTPASCSPTTARASSSSTAASAIPRRRRSSRGSTTGSPKPLARPRRPATSVRRHAPSRADEVAVTVVVAAPGYPDAPETATPIDGDRGGRAPSARSSSTRAPRCATGGS